jgi:hypothetical protein
MKRKQLIEVNMAKAYAFLWDQCTKTIQYKIEAKLDFILLVKGNPIELLKAIQQHSSQLSRASIFDVHHVRCSKINDHWEEKRY